MRYGRFATAFATGLLAVLTSCGDDDGGDSTLSVAWRFESGDCASNAVDEVRVTLTPQGGTASTKEFACAAGSGEVGEITSAGSHSILAEGLDATGKVRFTSKQTATFSSGKTFGPLDVTLRPKPSSVVVTWNGCPGSVILPYQIAIYRPPATGTSLTDKVKETQESCQTKKATLEGIAPGEYVVEVDSRATTPAVRGTEKVTVVAGEDAEVNVPVP